MESNFVRADNSNLPKIDSFMVAMFFKDNADYYAAELKNVKTAVSARESYGDDAIGYVQLQRKDGNCTVKCKICPEHKVRAKAYNVTLIVNENDSEIISCQCHDCAASAGGCKHAVAFIMWVHRRSEEPACTSIQCYWKKSTLAKVGVSMKFITVQQLSKKELPQQPCTSAVYEEFIMEAKKRKINNCELLKYQHDFKHSNVKQFSLHCLFLDLSPDMRADVVKIINLMKEIYTESVIKDIEESTKEQNKNSLWYEMRYGRITASKAHEASVCHKPDGSLVATIMGATLPDTAAMKRGRNLELSVRKTVSNKLKTKIISCGLYVCREYPMIAASPDGLLKDAVIEIKCPTKTKTKGSYIKNGIITPKCMAQVQLQMFATGFKKCYFCIADSDYEKTKNVDITTVTYDSDYVNQLIEKLALFWKTNIYPILYSNTNLS
ncbi:unnamed protein product [Chrysodeixis includens]|uniref:YqaJ viral recombinase domain-containing protein n=1 Tax=Chrysodeixis includens TaxID=689277 RepID=A0A9P0BJT4_CHRIL|nr:unnamed protein product [Chrysodeixis includens]